MRVALIFDKADFIGTHFSTFLID